MSEGNREYKSDVFSMLMEDKANALQIYNALNDTSYNNPDDIEIVTLEKGVSLTVRNDAAFILDSNLSIYEHQSTVCPNMPIRSCIYYVSTVQPMLKDQDIYGRTKVHIPEPKFVVFYNGDADQPERYDLHLSDLFMRKSENPDMDVVCHVYNINKGRNKDLLEKAPVLAGYMTFVDYVRSYKIENEGDLKTAIELAIERCINRGILADFFKERRQEVIKAMQMDYTFDRRIEIAESNARKEAEEARIEGLATGRAEGLIEERIHTLLEFGKSREECIADIRKRYSLSVDDAQKYFDEFGRITV